MAQTETKQVGTATLTFNNKQAELPVLGGSLGTDCMDVRKLQSLSLIHISEPTRPY